MSLILELIEATGLSGLEIAHIVNTAPARYRVYQIRKRNGGFRTIAQPSRELKAIQRFILQEKLSRFKTHECAMAYVNGKNIYANALVHKKSRCILKLDFRNFFSSIKVKDWERHIIRSDLDFIQADEVKTYSKVLFWGEERRSTVPRCLSIGAPTSPMISNIIMYDFDVIMSNMAVDMDLNYTRYADDIVISGERDKNILLMEKFVYRLVRQMVSPKLEFNNEKRGLYTLAQRRLVTGLVITPTQAVSIGRERKRKISAMLHRLKLGQLSIDDRGLLKGLLGFTAANEPEFIGRMRVKYGDTSIDEAMKFHVPRKGSPNPTQSES